MNKSFEIYYDLIDDSHNKIIENSILSVFKDDFTIINEVICDNLHIINFLKDFV
jgi:hypothetical protein